MGKDITKNVIINGRTTAGFNQLSAKIGRIASEIAEIGSKVTEWEKESVETYRSYQDHMLGAQGALTAQYESATELSDVMKTLDKQAQQWAKSTIFHTDDVSAAIEQAAHAGWTLEEMLAGIPQAMLLAQAGGLDLSTGLDYLIKGLNATETSFDDAGKFIGQWAMAANRSATDINEIGEALLSLGTTAVLNDSTAELFTLMATLADVGTTGTRAGTMLRGTMIRLIAPTKTAAEAMDSLQISSEEAAEEIGDDYDALASAGQMLEKVGFSAYDSEGNLKSFIQIYKDLYKAIYQSGMTPKDQNAILKAIFPQRNFAAGQALIKAAGKDFGGLYQDLLGENGQYAQDVSDIMMSGLTGSIELFLSKYEELQRKVGSSLEGPVTDLLGTLGGLIDGITNLPEAQFNALVGGITTIGAIGVTAGAATALVTAITALGMTGTGLIVAAGAIGAIVSYVTTLSENQFKDSFGTLELDVKALSEYVNDVSSKLGDETSKVKGWANAVDEAQTNYSKLVTAFSEQLLMETVTSDLTETDVTSLQTKGKNIIQALQDGIQAGKARDLTLLQTLFGDESGQKGAYQNGANWVETYYSELYGEAAQIGQNIKDSLTTALQNGELTPADRAAIQAQLDRLHEINAAIANGQAQEALYAQQYAASRVSWESASAFLESNAQAQEAALAAVDDYYASAYGRYRNAWEAANAKGEKFTYTDANGKTVTVDASERAWKAFEEQFRGEHEAARLSEAEKYGSVQETVLDTLMRDSGMASAWAMLKYIRDTQTKNEFGSYETGNVDWGTVSYLMGEGGADSIMAMFEGFSRIAEVIGDTELSGPIADLVEMASSQGFLRSAYSNLTNTTEEETASSVAAAQAYLDSHPGNWPVTPVIGTPETSGEPLEEYATGGRATSASIFGEAGAEWAIPEEHSDRTAELLNAARQASGFSWSELISRNGGLNGSPGDSGITITYAPTINTGSTEGLDAILANDKQRLRAVIDKLMRERDMRNRAAVYA